MTFHSVGNVIIQTDELHHFSEGLVETTNQGIIGDLFNQNGDTLDI
jgi:hypothetical protein